MVVYILAFAAWERGNGGDAYHYNGETYASRMQTLLLVAVERGGYC